MADKYYVNDSGVSIILNCGEDISTCASCRIFYEKPGGTTGTWSGATYTISGATNYIAYTNVVGDFDEEGEYEVQSGVSFTGGWSGRGKTARFLVYARFE